MLQKLENSAMSQFAQHSGWKMFDSDLVVVFDQKWFFLHFCFCFVSRKEDEEEIGSKPITIGPIGKLSRRILARLISLLRNLARVILINFLPYNSFQNLSSFLSGRFNTIITSQTVNEL